MKVGDKVVVRIGRLVGWIGTDTGVVEEISERGILIRLGNYNPIWVAHKDKDRLIKQV